MSFDEELLAAALTLTAPKEAPPPYISPMERAAIRYIRELNDVMPGGGYYHFPINLVQVVIKAHCKELLALVPEADQALSGHGDCAVVLQKLLSAIRSHTDE